MDYLLIHILQFTEYSDLTHGYRNYWIMGPHEYKLNVTRNDIFVDVTSCENLLQVIL